MALRLVLRTVAHQSDVPTTSHFLLQGSQASLRSQTGQPTLVLLASYPHSISLRRDTQADFIPPRSVRVRRRCYKYQHNTGAKVSRLRPKEAEHGACVVWQYFSSSGSVKLIEPPGGSRE
jgi:hypothetical protein